MKKGSKLLRVGVWSPGPPLLPPPSAARDRLCAGALQAALRRHAQGARRALSLSTHSQGCPGGIIADEPEEHSLVAEFGMYYK